MSFGLTLNGQFYLKFLVGFCQNLESNGPFKFFLKNIKGMIFSCLLLFVVKWKLMVCLWDGG